MSHFWEIIRIIWICKAAFVFSAEIPFKSKVDVIPCEEGWFLFDETCYKVKGIEKGLDWDDALNSCSFSNGTLVTINSKELQDFLVTFLLLNIQSNVWIGLHDTAKESEFKWSDGSRVGYTNWESKEPSSNYLSGKQEDCVEMRFKARGKTGMWNDLPCSTELPYICQQPKSIKKHLDPRFCSIEEGGGWKYLNSCYHIIDEEKSWPEAEEYCQENFDAHLTTILDLRNDLFLNYILANYSKVMWIGIKMREETQQKWASGWNVAYNKWHSEKRYFVKGTCTLRLKDGMWATGPCLNKYSFICEKSTSKPPTVKQPPQGWKCPDISKDWRDLGGEYCYFFETSNSLTWHDANYECTRRGGCLASIHSVGEEIILHPHVINTQERILIGLHRSLSDEHVFEWADGSAMDYKNWNDGEPNNLNEKCGELWTESMKWNDVPCTVTKGFICSIKKVAPNITECETHECNCPSEQSLGTIIAIIICLSIIALLCIIIYYYRTWFGKQREKIFSKIFSSPTTETEQGMSSEAILKENEFRYGNEFRYTN